MRRRLGVLLAQLDENTQKRIMTAFINEAYSKDFDVCIFSMYLKYQDTELRDIGDSNIFSLIQYSEFDGLLILLDTLLTPGLEDRLLQSVKEQFDGPVLVADKANDYFDYILMDHYTPFKKIAEHLIKDHGYKDIAFLGGKEGHPHSVARFNAYLDAMKEAGLSVREDRIKHGNYWYNSGHEFADYLYENKDDMPEAVLCANDYMAIGVAVRLSEYGYNIPSDIAIAGYDSSIEGRLSPVPLTSAMIPADSFGKLCFNRLYEKITDTELEEVILDTPILKGGSCGCGDYVLTSKKINRDTWKTDNSEVSFYSDFNHIIEDMFCQNDFGKFYEVIAKYSYQIKPFDKFYLCMNDSFLDPELFIGDNARRVGYSSKMNLVIKCESDGFLSQTNSVDFDRQFDTYLMLPDLYEERDYPTTFVFTPMFFEDTCFGYAVFNPGREIKIYNETYRIWMRNVNQGIEAFYRQKVMTGLLSRIKAEQVRDKDTGLYNYRGFHQGLSALESVRINDERSVAIIAFDIDNLSAINNDLSRMVGDSAIHALARFVSSNTRDDEICARIGNDEFLIGMVDDDCEERYEDIISAVSENGIAYKDSEGNTRYIQIHHIMRQGARGELANPDFLINRTVNAKNHVKKMSRQDTTEVVNMPEEMILKCSEVQKILDDSLLTYYFQPIVDVRSVKIYGYEALMRYEGATKLVPLEIIKCAEHLGRLYDVEKCTFNGVLDILEKNPENFADAKVFINSLPSCQLKGEDSINIILRLKNHGGKIVVEFTEQSEFSDEALTARRDEYDGLNIEVALDDYGSGYSNANNLIRYNPKYVKIDHMLIENIDSNPQKRHFVSSIIDYAGRNNVKVLAEGVETKEELRTVIRLGVDMVQGFFIGHPQPKPILKLEEETRLLIKRYGYESDTFDPLKL